MGKMKDLTDLQFGDFSIRIGKKASVSDKKAGPASIRFFALFCAKALAYLGCIC